VHEVVEGHWGDLEDDPIQQKRQVQKVHEQEKCVAGPMLAVDIVPCPRLPSEDLVVGPTGLLLGRTQRHKLHHRAMLCHCFAMVLHLGRSCHILHHDNRMGPRE